jgi:hypothetical protein
MVGIVLNLRFPEEGWYFDIHGTLYLAAPAVETNLN